MYSKALSILDANTVEYMVEQQRKEILELTEVLKDKDRALEDKDKALEAQKKELDRLRALLAGKQTAHLSS